MNTIETTLARRSIRRFKSEPIPPQDLTAILEAGRQAPSAANRQPWHFVVVTDAEQKQRVAQACNGQMWMADAACILVACGLPQVSAKWYLVDVAIALENMVLAAYSLGYGTCWIGAFEAQDVRRACAIPDDVAVVACTPLGLPDSNPPARARKEWDQVFSRDTFGQPL
jgi:nitroreductase